MSLVPTNEDIAYAKGIADGLNGLKKDIDRYIRRLLDEAEHAQQMKTKEVQFAATTGAAVLDRVIQMIDARLEP